jgi:hypothetical protein
MAERPEGSDPPAPNSRRFVMKKLIVAVALVLAFAAPAMAQTFPNEYCHACQE